MGSASLTAEPGLEATTGLTAYQAQILDMRRSPYLDYPAHVHLETLSLVGLRNLSLRRFPFATSLSWAVLE